MAPSKRLPIRKAPPSPAVGDEDAMQREEASNDRDGDFEMEDTTAADNDQDTATHQQSQQRRLPLVGLVDPAINVEALLEQRVKLSKGCDGCQANRKMRKGIDFFPRSWTLPRKPERRRCALGFDNPSRKHISATFAVSSLLWSCSLLRSYGPSRTSSSPSGTQYYSLSTKARSSRT